MHPVRCEPAGVPVAGQRSLRPPIRPVGDGIEWVGAHRETGQQVPALVPGIDPSLGVAGHHLQVPVVVEVAYGGSANYGAVGLGWQLTRFESLRAEMEGQGSHVYRPTLDLTEVGFIGMDESLFRRHYQLV